MMLEFGMLYSYDHDVLQQRYKDIVLKLQKYFKLEEFEVCCYKIKHMQIMLALFFS
jgi:hypothetical protein